jgi:hypothetical protein
MRSAGSFRRKRILLRHGFEDWAHSGAQPFGCDRHGCVRIGIVWQALVDRDQFTKVGGGPLDL